jgi:branched-subunit amino acid transport protein
MSDAWIVIIALTVTTALIRASGPVIMGERDIHPRAAGVVDLLAPALLTALIVVEVFGSGDEVQVDASLAGVAAAGGILWWRSTALLPALIAAAVVTAGLRAIGV